ncbi:TetR/AcrR family transcriptional regulator [Pseudobacteriovorax antillogorgiicola]|uniref:Transcriptional regulator, TetR family n=1 Tax=Pseudobacteriovorax antillogorgiicola TaxID=1513793 RepID=A0A1Y6BIZ3_9BACT|nr:TetR/AcrR family transcriptional regulator [Pseudobacteriovorax antillogorgiicola]TCS55476.1 TetR family transcriptional regulator [Pseudobacteriovorax antillogorgiicola]SMF12010.1 transcriptional regulator, TetR family [Pseudobacteriovorax antillogorgiicola]
MPTPRIENLDTERIAQIMTIALREFAEHDYQRSSFNRIIKNCGMSKGTMYYYFENKQDLFMTLLIAISKDFQALANRELPSMSSGAEFWTEVEVQLETLMAILSQKPTLGRFIQNLLTSESRHATSPASPWIDSIDEWLEDFILTGQLVGGVRRDLPIDLILQMAWGIWETCSHWLQSSSDQNQAKESAAMMKDFFQRSLEQRADL